MKKKLIVSLLVIVMLVLAACEPLQQAPVDAPAKELTPANQLVSPSLPPATDIPPTATAIPVVVPAQDPIKIEYAKGFTLEYKEGYKLLTVLQPWFGADQSFSYALVAKGTTKLPDVGSAQLIYTPVDSFVAFSTTYYPFLEAIGELDTLVAIDCDTYTNNPTVLSMAKDGKLVSVGGGSSGQALDLEKIIDLKPELIMASATGSTEWDVHPALLKAGLPVVINSDYLEQDPLARAEWGKFVAAFYDKEAEAAKQFDALVVRYQEAKALTANVSKKLTVFTNTDYQGSWFMPGAESYVATLLRDAGAEYLWNDLPGSGASPLASELVFERAKDADYWLNVGFASDLASLKAMDARYSDFAAFKNGHVYNFNKRVNANGGVDYYESGVAAPDVVLKDLIKIFYPDLLPDYELYYYQALR